MQAYKRISEELLPTPAKSHYTFNMRDLSKLFQGMLMILPANCKDKETLQHLWVHESMRVFHDRLIDNEDKDYFKHMLVELITQKFGQAASYDDLFVDRCEPTGPACLVYCSSRQEPSRGTLCIHILLA